MALLMQASWEAEELRANTLALEDQLQDAQAQADAVQSELTKREHELSHAHSTIAHLEHLAQECEALPGLRADLQDAQARGDELQVARDQLQVPCLPYTASLTCGTVLPSPSVPSPAFDL